MPHASSAPQRRRRAPRCFDLAAVPFVVATIGVGCASGPQLPPVDPTAPPETIIQTLSGRRLYAGNKWDGMFGLDSLHKHLRPLEMRCQADGGTLVQRGMKDVRFDFRDPGGNVHSANVSLPRTLGCRSLTGRIGWGVSLSYEKSAMYIATHFGNDFGYSADVPLQYIAATTFDRTEPNGNVYQETARRRLAECSAKRDAYTQRVRQKPQVGMPVDFSVIVDVKPPLALVQYDSFGRNIKGREQEWVPISTLAAGSDRSA